MNRQKIARRIGFGLAGSAGFVLAHASQGPQRPALPYH